MNLLDKTDNIYTTLGSALGPVVWAIVVLAIAFIFKAEIVRFLNRLKSLEIPGVSFATHDLADAQKNDTNDALLKTVDPQPTQSGASQTMLLLPGKDAIPKIREQFLAEHPRVDSDSPIDKDKAYSIFWYMAWASEYLYRLLFGSQILLLFQLNGRPSMSIVEARDVHGHALAQGSKQPFEDWLAYLIMQDLVSQVGTNISIGEAGKLFVQFVVKEGYPLDKPW